MNEVKDQNISAPPERSPEKRVVVHAMRKGRAEPVFPPGSRQGLKNVINKYLGITVPDVRVCGGHATPMDYLWHSYSRDFWRLTNDDGRLAEEKGKFEIRSMKSETNAKSKNSNEKNCRLEAGVTNGDCIVWANRAGGKTQLAAIATLLEGLFKPDCQTRILAGSLSQSGRMFGYLRDYLCRVFPGELEGKLLKESCRFRSGAGVELLAQSSRSVRGQHVQKLRCDEIELFDADVLHAAKFITQSSRRQAAAMEMFSTMHRPYGLMQTVIDEAIANQTPVFKWCLWEVIETCTEDRSCSRCALDEDCQGKARQANGYLRIDDAITQMRRSSRNGFESEMLCLRPNLENAVFGDFDECTHIRPVGYDPTLPLYRAMDFGFTNPFVCLWIQVDDEGVVRVFDEYVQRGVIIAKHADVVKLRTPCGEEQVAGTFVDPAGAGRNGVTGTSEVKVLRDKGIVCQCCKSEIMEGVEMIRAALKAGDGTSRLVISPKCKNLIKAMQCYHYPDAGAKGASELPVKDGEHDHPIDALRYFFVNRRQSKKTSRLTY